MKYFYLLEILFCRRPGLIAGDVGVDHGVVVVQLVQLGDFEQLAGVGLVDTLDGAVVGVPVVGTVLNNKYLHTSLYPDTYMGPAPLTFQGNLMLTDEARKYIAQPIMTL